MKFNEPFILFACCLLVKGFTRSLICDIQRKKIHLIPNSLFEILSDHQKETLSEVLSHYNKEDHPTIIEYFEYLIEEELLFFSETPSLFPNLSMYWDTPSEITNAIIDIGESDSHLHYDSIFEQLEKLGCRHIQIRSYFDRTYKYFEVILGKLKSKRIFSIDLIIKYNTFNSNDYLLNLCKKFPRIFVLIIHSSPKEKNTISLYTRRMGNLTHISEMINSEKNCGIISPNYFTINVKTFTESQHHNSCLNRKISIDKNGEIRNCPSMKGSYGNIKNTTLKEALSHPDFKKYWNINKDKIHICKDCEFRYICTDCRAYLEDPDDIYSKPLKCGYNPYTGEWEEWSKNPLKKRAVEYYGMQDLVDLGTDKRG